MKCCCYWTRLYHAAQHKLLLTAMQQLSFVSQHHSLMTAVKQMFDAVQPKFINDKLRELWQPNEWPTSPPPPPDVSHTVALWVSTKMFPSCCISHWWTASTAPFLDAWHSSVQHWWKKKKNATVEVLMVKGKQLLLTFSWGFQPPQRVINLDPVF